ncbi:menaquinol oxidoreductase [candidate division GN15 bacterium]|nr:menaquinol oxidoreductase [candidate division GN15 bacterium]
MGILVSLIAVILLLVISLIGVGVLEWRYLFGVILPYAAIATFIVGIVYRVVKWARAPVPFRVPTTCGQQKSHPWIEHNSLENPSNTWQVIKRMFLEVFLFRSLFRNTNAEVKDGPRIVYGPDKWLWAAGLAFHYSFLVIFIRHFKYFAEPTPEWVLGLQHLDGFFQVGLPIILASDLVIIAALGYLFLRRVWDQKLRYISLPADYFPLFLIGAIATSGICMRYFAKTDLTAVKALGTGLLGFSPTVPEGIGVIFFIHMFFVTALIAYFPFSKLVHMAGVFMSPTRNMANNNRVKRHINPWNPEVKMHTYDEYEDEFRDVMKAAGLPVEKEE